MMMEYKPGFRTIVLAMLTVAAILLAWNNFQQQRKFQSPEDGVTWQDADPSVVALYVQPEGPGAKAGIREGDTLAAVNGLEIPHSTRVVRILFKIGPWHQAEYSLHR